jgi:aryl-alcohol dehydrogenase-like predicted oxidoreductase
MRAFDDLVRQGKVLYAGASDMPAWVVARANTLAELRGWTPFVRLQIEYSLIERTPERELLPMAAGLGLGVTAWSPLAGGVLTGKQLEAGGAKDSRQNDPTMRQFMASNARKGAPSLAALVKLADAAERVGRIGRHTVFPPMTALLELARAAENYAQAMAAPLRRAG